VAFSAVAFAIEPDYLYIGITRATVEETNESKIALATSPTTTPPARTAFIESGPS